MPQLDMDKSKVEFRSGNNQVNAEGHSMNGDHEVYYAGKKIGDYHRVNGSYPASVTTLAGNSAGFKSPWEAVRFLYDFANSLPVDINIFPSGQYILRVHEVLVLIDPVPGAPIRVKCKIHYNTKRATGSSAASKPTNSEMATINLADRTISTKAGLVFDNLDDVLDKLSAAVDKAVAALVA